MLTDIQVRNAKPAEKAFRLPDTGGLHLFVTPAGGKLWRLRYKLKGGTEKLLSFGQYPTVTLAAARDSRDDAKRQLRKGIDPASVAKHVPIQVKLPTFEEIGREWHKLQKPRWTKIHAKDVIESLEPIFKVLGGTAPDQITVPDVLAELRKIEARPAIETARRVRQRMSAIFTYAIATGRGSTDPAAVVKGALAPLIKGRQPAVTSLTGVHEILVRVAATPKQPVTLAALRLLALTAVRPGEIRGARWHEFDFSEAVWVIPAERMKMKREHVAPLSRQALAELDTLDRSTPFVFPNARQPTKPMSENAIGYLLNRAGYHGRHVPHGWRAAFSTIMNERFRVDRDVIDLMLAHAPKDRVEAAYNRALHLDRRRELAQIWADLLMPVAAESEELVPPDPEAVHQAPARVARMAV